MRASQTQRGRAIQSRPHRLTSHQLWSNRRRTALAGPSASHHQSATQTRRSISLTSRTQLTAKEGEAHVYLPRSTRNAGESAVSGALQYFHVLYASRTNRRWQSTLAAIFLCATAVQRKSQSAQCAVDRFPRPFGFFSQGQVEAICSHSPSDVTAKQW